MCTQTLEQVIEFNINTHDTSASVLKSIGGQEWVEKYGPNEKSCDVDNVPSKMITELCKRYISSCITDEELWNNQKAKYEAERKQLVELIEKFRMV